MEINTFLPLDAPGRVVRTSRENTAEALGATSPLAMQGGAPRPWYQYVAAPMVDQSDLAFRLTTVQFGATATWTQMYHAQDVLTDVDPAVSYTHLTLPTKA